ncbi:SDR family oxidoreductase [Bordetella genomosp. 12]|uniref:Short-chain dehydrogenase n=1 Tax=Bordetella genomosp. 12 TaxID=463035 RepID=A0A261V929_9BORD|nr:SDR family oxidoreductase [Bordetella genomosp. 12]OZI70686.1 short-chain dehydrogenase [Bordetella genomosp. 12]
MTDTFAILTGASRGLGAALARGLLRPGIELVTLARRNDPALADLARDHGVTLRQIQVDLADTQAATRAAAELVIPRDAKRYVLINNAGTVHPVANTKALSDAAAISQALALNVTAVMLLTARFLQAVDGLQADRRIINISSGAGRNPTAGWGVYCTTKAALDMYTRVLKTEHGASGLRAVSLAPGIVDTGMQADIRASDPAAFPGLSRFQDFHATGKLAAPADVAANILAYLDREDFGQTEIDDIRNYH